MFLFKDTLLTIYCWFTNPELKASNAVASCLNESYQTLVFSPKGTQHLLTLIRQQFSITLEGHLKHQTHRQKAPKCEKHALNRPHERYLFAVSELEQEGRVSSFFTSARNVHVWHQIFFYHSAHVHKWLQSAISVDFGGANKF